MVSLFRTGKWRDSRRAYIPWLSLCLCAQIAFASLALPMTALVASQTAAPALAADTSDSEIAQFYAARSGTPLWFSNAAGDAPRQLFRLLSTADADGLDPKEFQLGELLVLFRKAENGDPASISEADAALSRAFARYVRAIRRDPKVGVIYVDSELKPKQPSAGAVLAAASKAASLADYIREVGWMNPLYGQLREAIVAVAKTPGGERYQLALNLERTRALPAASERYVLVNTANQRLTMYEKGKAVGQMKIVVGRPDAQTPLMNAYIRFAIMNPYWNVPADLTRKLAPNVVRQGKAYLKTMGYEVVTSFDEGASIVDPATIDWKAVAAGRIAVQMRQLPGPANSMGRVKYMFPNTQGVWLHDTPSREHFAKDVRLISSGCVRLEDAWSLGSWLLDRKFRPAGTEPERRIELPKPVPVYITYLTAIPDGPTVRFIADVYKRDPPPLEAP